VEGLRELFGYSFDRGLTYRLKKAAAEYYVPAYLQVKERVKASGVVYADETPVKLKKRSGYVWVFATLEDVLYVFSDTREASVVQTVLDGFEGVLVSDFYAAYDGVPCAQQKCLIHLMRDINSDLFKNPFDEQLKELTKAMTAVLVPIVEVIDKYGLKKSHLGKFRKNADKFVRSVADRTLESEVAISYQRRIVNYRDKLFEFLNHDGVAWNNNNAEQAIKRFAMLRRAIGGASTGNGIQQYLVLLSICETLRRKSMSFLRFLLSQSIDLNEFVASR